jgi:hypothetical protein
MLVLAVLLILFPLGSFLYLKAGYDHRVEALSELEFLGEVASSDLGIPAGQTPTVDVIYWSPTGAADSVGISISNVHEAFNEEPAVRFVGLGLSQAGPLLPDPKQAIEVPATSGSKAEFQSITSASPHCSRLPLNQQAIVVDTAGTIRRCYDLHSGQEVARLVEHLTILVPKAPKEDLFLERREEY